MALNREKIVAGAQKFIQRGQLDKAIKEFQRILEEDPKDVRTLLKIGDLYSKKGERDNATQTYLKVAEFYSDQGFFLKAVAVYKQILKVDPNLIQVNVKLADLYNQLGLASDALAQYQSVALHFEKAGDIPKTIGVLRKMIELEPNNVGSRIKLAEVYAKQQMPADAVGELSKAATLLKQNGRVDDYARVTERILHLQPDDANLSKELAEFYLEHNDVKRALAKLQVCFKTNPRDIRTLEMLAQSFTALGQTHKTISVYRELAKIYAEGNDDTKRRQYLRKILELAPDDEEAKEVELRATPGAAVAAGAAPPPTPKGPPAKPSEAMQKLLTETDVYMKYGLRDKALEHLKKIFAIQPENLDAHGKVRDIYVQNGDSDGAKKTLLTMGQIAIARELSDKAREWLTEAVRMEGGSAEAKELLATLPEDVSEEIAEDDFIEDVDEIPPEAEEESIELAPPEEDVAAPEGIELELAHEGLPPEEEEEGIDLAMDEHDVDLHSEPISLDATTSAGVEPEEDDLFGPSPGGDALELSAPDEDEGISLELPDDDEIAALTTAPASEVTLALGVGLDTTAAENPAVEDLSPPKDDFELEPGEGKTEVVVRPEAAIAKIAEAHAAEKADAEKRAAQMAADEAAEQKRAADEAEADASRLAAEQIAAEKAAGEKRAADEAAAERAAAAKLAAEKEAAEKFAAEKVAAEKAAAEKAAAQKAIEPELEDLDLAPPEQSHELDLDLGPAPPLAAVDSSALRAPLAIDDAGRAAPKNEPADAGAPEDLFDEPTTSKVDLPQAMEEEVTSPGLAAAPSTVQTNIAPTAKPAAPEVDITDELGEAEFFEQQGLTDDAIDGYRSVLTKAPNTTRARERLEALTGETWPEPETQTPVAAKPAPKVEPPVATSKPAAVAKIELKAAGKPIQVVEKAPPPKVTSATGEAKTTKPLEVKSGEAKSVELKPQEKKAEAKTAELKPSAAVEAKKSEPKVAAPPVEVAKPKAAEPKPAESKPAAPTASAPAGTKSGGVTKQLISQDALGDFDNFDLAGELADDFNDAAQEAAEIERKEDEQFSADEIFAEFKKGVAATVTDDDYATHYDLGIAYKEMGLVDDAIREFEVAAKGAQKEVDALVMVGICRIEENDPARALAAFKRAGQSDHITPKQALAVRYELANAMDKNGDAAGAQLLFAKVATSDPTYRDAKARSAGTSSSAPAATNVAAHDVASGERPGEDSASEDSASSPAEPPAATDPPKKGKISYV